MSRGDTLAWHSGLTLDYSQGKPYRLLRVNPAVFFIPLCYQAIKKLDVATLFVKKAGNRIMPEKFSYHKQF
jgi:hypothetical protein